MEADSRQTIQLLSFVLDNELFAVSVEHVREILDKTETTRIPRMPPYMRGALNVRGAVVPVIDLRVKFGLSPARVTVDTCVIVIEVDVDGETTVLGAMVDAVRDVFELDADDLGAPPRMGTKLDTEFIEAMARHDDDFLIVLDIDKVLSVDEVIVIRRAVADEAKTKTEGSAKAKRPSAEKGSATTKKAGEKRKQ